MEVQDVPTTKADPAPRDTPLASWLERFPRLPAMLLLSVVVVVLVVPTVRTVSKISLIDEREHIDNMLRGSHFRIGHIGQELTQETLRELCSRGRQNTVWPPCPRNGERLNASDFAFKGINTSAQDPPYYVVTGVTARALRALLPGWESLVTWARVLGAVWLLTGMYLVLRVGDLLDVDRKLTVVALVLVAAVPSQLHAETTVNPDAMAFLAGAAILLAGVAWERGRANLAWLIGVSPIAIWLDRANAVALLIVLVYLVLRAWTGARGDVHGNLSWRRCIVAGVAVAVATTAFVGIWQTVERRLRPPVATVAPSSPGRVYPREATPDRTKGFPIEEAVSNTSVFGMLPPIGDVAPPPERMTGATAVWYQMFGSAALLAILGALGAAIFGWSVSNRIRVLAAGIVVALVITPILNHLYNYFVNGYYVATVPRFGLSALPAIALVFAAIASRSKVAFALLGFIAAALYTTALLTLL